MFNIKLKQNINNIIPTSSAINSIEDISGKNYLTDYLLLSYHIPRNLNLTFIIKTLEDNHSIQHLN